MSGTPEKILEHLLETIKLDSNGNDAVGEPSCGSSWLISPCWLSDRLCCFPADACVSDFLLTHKVFMPSSQLCSALQHQYPVANKTPIR